MMEKYTVLLLDDDCTFRKIMLHALKLKFNPITIDNCKEAWEILYNRKVDCLLVDLFLGDENGVDFIQKVREITSIPVIAISGSDDAVLINQAFEAGSDDYIIKSNINYELLAHKIACQIFKYMQKIEIQNLHSRISATDFGDGIRQDLQAIREDLKNLNYQLKVMEPK